VLLLRDVLGYRASEAAELLGLTEDAVTSALKRARATMEAARSPNRPPPAAGGQAERALVDRFVAAFTEQDVDALVALAGDRICEVTHFETTLASYFGLPRILD
jgi:predicted transcriptional regulator